MLGLFRALFIAAGAVLFVLGVYAAMCVALYALIDVVFSYKMSGVLDALITAGIILGASLSLPDGEDD